MWGGRTSGSMVGGYEGPRGVWVDGEKGNMGHGELLTVRNHIVQVIDPCYKSSQH